MTSRSAFEEVGGDSHEGDREPADDGGRYFSDHLSGAQPDFGGASPALCSNDEAQHSRCTRWWPTNAHV
jgi:hypothetical protein